MDSAHESSSHAQPRPIAPQEQLPLELIATAGSGMEAIVSRELVALGYPCRTVSPGRLLFRGDAAAICRTNLWLRTAERVLLRVASFPATDFGVLFDATKAIPWENWIPPGGSFPVSGRSLKSQLSSVPACQRIVKKAIVERLREVRGGQWLDESEPLCAVEIALLEDQATLTIDTTGDGLHKRGYRTLVGAAPLRETLAAALVQLSYWRPDRPLVDPFCGSGTIPIEAALIGRNLAPGLNRTFSAEAWPLTPGELWTAMREEARGQVRDSIPGMILGSDTDPEALKLARFHAENAGVAADVHFQPRDFADLSSKRDYGCVITNPPYGERISELEEVEAIYRQMPHVLRRLKTWSHYILSPHPNFEGLLGQRADRRRKVYNGRIACTYFQFHGPRPPRNLPVEAPPEPFDQAEGEARDELATDAPAQNLRSVPSARPAAGAASTRVRAPVVTDQQAFGGLNAKAIEQTELFRSRLAKRARHLRRWPTRQGITCFRLYERDIPEIPLVVDRYEDHLHIAEFDRPHQRTPAEHDDWLEQMARTAGQTLEVPRSQIFLKHRAPQRGTTQYQRQGSHGYEITVQEAGLKFRVNLSDYLDTGLFLDHRITRGMVREQAAGKRVLNLFGYTGAFTVYAAAGGAAQTTTVDLSATYLDWAKENLLLNGFQGAEHRLLREDSLDYLRNLPARAAFDLAVVDPPTFSNSKRLEQDWDVQRDYEELLNLVLARLAPAGVIYFSTNFRRFKFNEAAFAGVAIREISKQTVPPDFRNARIHRCWRMVKS